MTNREIADHLIDYARYLDVTEPNLFRTRSYRRAALTILNLPYPLKKLVEEKGRAGIQKLPGIGAHLAYTLETLIRTGDFKTWADRVEPKRVGA